MRSLHLQAGDVWLCRDAFSGSAIGAMIFAASVFGIALLFAGSSFREKLPFILLFLVLVAVLYSSLKRVSTVVISRKDATIRKEERAVTFSRSRTYSLYGFNSVAMTEQPQLGEEGYQVPVYSLVLQGPDKSLTLTSTNDRVEAERLRDDLSLYLGFSAESLPIESLHTMIR